MPNSARCFSRRLLLFGTVSLLLAILFGLGYDLGRGGGVSTTVGMQVANLSLQRRDLSRELDEVKARLEDSERQRLVLERAQQIDVESSRVLKEQLRRALGDNLSLSRELSYLKRLIQKGGKGAVQVSGFRLVPTAKERVFRYSFSAAQILSEFGRSQGAIRLRLDGRQAGEAASLSLEDLPFADPAELKMDFDHMQNLTGEFELPAGFEPDSIVVDVEPSTKQLISTSAVFPWSVDSP
ncbi:DUF6776 family protein [Thiorhodococcus fuscus]|uniref:DUF6776 family protein n=1 Tax=Thiorhodococcus fuscus TaxID=527200 RepID=A0ABW4YBF6_9GAMM